MTAAPLPDHAPRSAAAQRAARLPVAIWALIVVMALAQLWMIVATAGRPTPGLWGVTGWELIFGLMFGSVGAFIAARRPDNLVGWLMVAVGLGVNATGIVNWYPVLSDGSPQPLPLAEALRWLSSWAWVVAAPIGIVFLPLVFPDGHLPSPRWWTVVALGVVAIVINIIAIILAVAPIGPLTPSPLAIISSGAPGPLLLMGFALIIAASAAAGASLVYRYRHADQVQQQQIKWVAYAFALMVPAVALGLSTLFIFTVLELAAIALVVISIAVAVLHYRLYEIDEIINRTLVYGFLTAILAGVYTASITLSQKLFSAITGERSDAAIVMTTLIVVSLFTPIKTRLQTVVDLRLKATDHPGALRPAIAGGPPLTSAQALDLLAHLADLHHSGDLTRAEFETAKAGLLAELAPRVAATVASAPAARPADV